MNQANVKLQIKELVLDGLPYNQRQRVAAALEGALQRLIAEQGLPEGVVSQTLSGIGPIEVSPHARAETVGRQVADNIFRQLNEGAGGKVAGGKVAGGKVAGGKVAGGKVAGGMAANSKVAGGKVAAPSGGTS